MKIETAYQIIREHYLNVKTSEKDCSKKLQDVYESTFKDIETVKVTPKLLFLIDGFDFDQETIDELEKGLK